MATNYGSIDTVRKIPKPKKFSYMDLTIMFTCAELNKLRQDVTAWDIVASLEDANLPEGLCVSRGSIYVMLYRLADLGCLLKSEPPENADQRRKYYTVTAKGQKVLHGSVQWLRSFLGKVTDPNARSRNTKDVKRRERRKARLRAKANSQTVHQ